MGIVSQVRRSEARKAKLKMNDSFRNLRHSLRQLMEYLAVEDGPTESDVIVGLGSYCKNVPLKAASLYQEGHARLIMFSGGHGRLSGPLSPSKPEAVEFKEIAEQAGVPPGAILIEKASTNCLENIVLSWELLEPLLLRRQVVLITQPVLQRRAWATAMKFWPGCRIVNCPPDWRRSFDQLELKESLLLGKLAVGEVTRLFAYAIKSNLQPQTMTKDHLEACATIRKAALALDKSFRWDFQILE